MEMLRETKKQSNSLNEQKNQTFVQSVSCIVNKSPSEILLILLKYFLTSNLSFTDMVKLFKTINFIFGKNILPETRYMMHKIFNFSDEVTFHAICNLCSHYIGTFDNITKIVKCDNCDIKIDVSNRTNPCFFAIIDPLNAIRDYLQTNENFYILVTKERPHKKISWKIYMMENFTGILLKTCLLMYLHMLR